MRLADAAAGIDPRPDDETGVIGARRLVDGGDVGQRRDARVAAPGHHLQALGDESPVDAGERHHVAHRAERHQIEPLHEVGFGLRPVPAHAPEGAVEADNQQEGDAHRRHLAVRAGLVEAVGVDHGDGRRQARLGLVVVDDDDLEPGRRRRRQGRVRAGAAIHGDHHRHPFFPEAEQRRLVGSVPLAEAVRDVHPCPPPGGVEETLEERRRSRPVDVVVAEHRHPFALHDGAGQALDGDVHVHEVAGVREKVAQGWIEEAFGFLDADAARRQHAADDLRQFQFLGQRQCRPIVEGTLQPAPSGQRPGDPEDAVVAGGPCRGSAHFKGLRCGSCAAARPPRSGSRSSPAPASSPPLRSRAWS